MALITLHEAKLAFGDEALLDGAEFAVEENERICLVGRNGTGKSTLLKVLASEQVLDDGRIIFRQGLKVVRLDQDPPLDTDGTVYTMAAKGLGEVGSHLADLALGRGSAAVHSDYIEKHDGWVLEARVYKVLKLLSLNASDPLASLSGGLRRKAALAAALVQEPEVLLLDEPTNHLDIEAITYLTGYLSGFKGTLIFVTHDRQFADDLASRIVELDRGQLYSYPGNFAAYLKGRDERLRLEALERKEFDRILAQEEAWIRRGVKARLARNEGRVRDLEERRRLRRERRDRQGRVVMQISEAERSGNIVFEANHIALTYEGQSLIDDFSAVVMRQDRIGIVGGNGVGKTSLIKILLGELKPDHGHVRMGMNVQPVYFDQYHEALDLEKSVADNVAEGRSEVNINGKNIHVLSYLKDFLFTARRARSPAKVLSGGEKNRLLLARLFAKPCNLLILDEPTNDLDLETLELLEEIVAGFNGTVMVVSHDRRFIDKVATETWVFDGKGGIEEIVGGWSEVQAVYQRRAAQEAEQAKSVKVPAAKETKPAVKEKAKSAGITFSERHELKGLPDKVEALELKMAELNEAIADPKLYQQGGDAVKALLNEQAKLQGELDAAYARWDELESKAAAE